MSTHSQYILLPAHSSPWVYQPTQPQHSNLICAKPLKFLLWFGILQLVLLLLFASSAVELFKKVPKLKKLASSTLKLWKQEYGAGQSDVDAGPSQEHQVAPRPHSRESQKPA